MKNPLHTNKQTNTHTPTVYVTIIFCFLVVCTQFDLLVVLKFLDFTYEPLSHKEIVSGVHT